MRQYFSILAALILSVSASTLKAQIVSIPDANLKAELLSKVSINSNGDTEIQLSEAQNFSGVLDVSFLSITDLTGLEEFTSMSDLYCVGNQITFIDFSANTMVLQEFYCYDNQLTSLDISGCPSLTEFPCYNNLLTSLDVSNATLLTELDCSNNQLGSLILSGTLNLEVLDCSDNQLTTLDISTCVALKELDCTDNQIATINLSGCINLIDLYCNDNALTALDISSCTLIEDIDCSFNSPLQALDFSMNDSLKYINSSDCGLRSLDMRNSNYTSILSFNTTSNPNLSCVEVLDTAYATANWTNIDPITCFSLISCSTIINIPDVNFKTYLLGTSVNTNGDTEIQLFEAWRITALINLLNLGISDLTGIEEFKNLTRLHCPINQLTSLDVSNNIKLNELQCYSNQLTSLDVSNNINLTQLSAHTNQIASLDVSNNINLRELYVGGSLLTTLDLSQNINLTAFNCRDAMLSTLNVKNGNNNNVTAFNVTENPMLQCIDVDDAAYSTTNWTDVDTGVVFSVMCFSNTATIEHQLPNLQVYPNPTHNNLNLNLGAMYANTSITISNTLGQAIQQNNYTNTQYVELELTGTTGVYLIHIETEKGSSVLKVMKQ